MLKYRINRDNLKNDAVNLNVSDIHITDIIDEDNLLASTKVVVCTYNDNINLKNINEVIGVNEYSLMRNNNDSQDYVPTAADIENKVIVNRYNIQGNVNLVSRTFSFSMPFLNNLGVKDITNNENDIYVTFTSPHYYTAIISNTLNNVDEDIYLWKNITTLFQNTYYLLGTESDFKQYEGEKVEKICNVEIITSKTFKITVNDKVKLDDFFFNDSIHNFRRYIPTIRFFRPNFLFTDLGTSQFLFYDYKNKVNIPLSTKQQINLNKESVLNDYITDAKKRSINKIVDMEKDIYYPVIYKEEGKYEDVYKIRFNFHFIRRDDENWTSETSNLWNGVEVHEDQSLHLSEAFFSYDEPSEQSDLLSYLNFTNNDVRYQKNKLRKSFIRLYFYDSPNMGNQNLLCYSTIFVNSGEQFNKYIKYMNENGYRMMHYEVADTTEDEQWKQVSIEPSNELIGIRVDREYSKEDEEKRLSSQITVNNKYASNASSEGFYLYIWRDILPVDELGKKGTQTVYMKVEYNHAGYGRIIPFIMPYWDKNKWDSDREIKQEKNIVDENNETKTISYTLKYNKRENKNIIKTFEDIIHDWDKTYKENSRTSSYNEVDENKDNGKVFTLTTDGQYSTKQYVKYSYIKMKIGYDESQKKYIYYLDNDVYGNVPLVENNVLTFNLYEVKMV